MAIEGQVHKADGPLRCATVANDLTPYRSVFHRRLVDKILELDLYTVLTHEQATLPWASDITPGHFARFPISDRPDSPASIARQVFVLSSIMRYLKRVDVEVVVVGGYNDLVRSGLIILLPFRRVHVLLAADSNDLLEDRKPTWKRIVKHLWLRLLQGRISAILAMGDSGREFFERYMTSPPPMFTVPYDLDVDRFSGRMRYDYEQACYEFDLDPGRRRILFVGRLVPVKGVDTLIEAFEVVARERLDWDLAIAGIGDANDDLRAGVPEWLQERVHWLGFVDHTQLPKLYASCHIFALLSRSEPWGVVATEALASGLPLVASDIAGAPVEIVGKYGGGILVPDDIDTVVGAFVRMTEPSSYEDYRLQAMSAFTKWRAESDPIAGFRAALRAVIGESRVAANSQTESVE